MEVKRRKLGLRDLESWTVEDLIEALFDATYSSSWAVIRVKGHRQKARYRASTVLGAGLIEREMIERKVEAEQRKVEEERSSLRSGGHAVWPEVTPEDEKTRPGWACKAMANSSWNGIDPAIDPAVKMKAEPEKVFEFLNKARHQEATAAQWATFGIRERNFFELICKAYGRARKLRFRAVG